MGRGVAIQPFDLLGKAQKTAHHLFFGGLAQTGFVGQGLGDADRFNPFQGNHLRQAVNLSIRQLQHPSHIAHRSLGQQSAKGDDLRHLLAPVFLLHIADHLFAAVHAKVDVKVGHRDALGVQEPLEQQGIAQRVKVGDRQRIGHK